MSRCLSLGLPLTALVGLTLLGCHSVSGPVANPGSTQFTTPPHDPHTFGLAAANLHVDLTTARAALRPLRDSQAIGDTFSEIGLTPAFDTLFGDHFKVAGLRRTGPTSIEVDFITDHPFSATVRPDLGIFNLKLWVAVDRPATTVGSIASVPGVVTNPDGYGRMWLDTTTVTPPAGTVDVQPYIILHEDSGSAPFDWHNPAGFNVLFPGQTSTDTLGLDLGGASTLDMRVFLTADYGQSAVRATRQSPAYELPKFAGNAPWKVAVTELSNTLQHNLATSSATFQVDIYDWKHGQGLSSDVTGATLALPDIAGSTPSTITLSGTGDAPTPLTGTVLLTNSQNAVEGDYWGLVTVNDSASGTGLKDDLTTPVTLSTYSTYQWFEVHVNPEPVTPPTASFTRCFGGILSFGTGERFDGSASTPGTNPIAFYDWDFDYVAPTFTVDATGVKVSHLYPANGTFIVALRVSDSSGHSDIATTTVDVNGSPGWATASRLTNNSEYETPVGSWCDVTNAMCVAPDGSVHLVYIISANPNIVYYHQEYSGCPPTWSPRELVYNSAPNYYPLNSSIVATADGKLHASFPCNVSFTGQFQYFVKSGGTWSGPQIITTQPAGYGGQANVGYLATDSADDLAFCDVRTRGGEVCPGSPAPPCGIFFQQLVSGSWTPQVLIGTSNAVYSASGCGSFSNYRQNLAFTGTNDGQFIAVWSTLHDQYNGITPVSGSDPIDLKWNKSTAGTWGSQSLLYAGATTIDFPCLRRSPNGTIWLSAYRSPIAPNLVLSTYNGTAWSALTAAFSSGNQTFANMSFNPNGRGCLITGATTPNGIVAKMWDQTDSLASIASAPATLLEGPAGYQRFAMQIAGTTEGRWVGAWVTDKYSGGPFTGREFDTNTWQ